MIQSVLYGKPHITRLLSVHLLNFRPGIYFVLFVRTMGVLFCRNIVRTEVHRVMIATAIVMWIIATGVCNPHVSCATRPVADTAVMFSTFR